MKTTYDERELLPRLIPSARHPFRTICCDISPTDINVGEMLSQAMADNYGDEELPSDKITVHFRGNAGDGFGKGLCPGVTFVADEIGQDGCHRMTGGIAVLLGSTGEGLCNGLTGGRVYVYCEASDLTAVLSSGAFTIRCIKSGSEEDLKLRDLVEEHAKLTNSACAKKLISDWNGKVKNFTCITAAA